MKDASLAWVGFFGLFFLAVYVDYINTQWRMTRDRPRHPRRQAYRWRPVGVRHWRRDHLTRGEWVFLIFSIVCGIAGVTITLLSR